MATRKAITLVSGLFQEVNTPTDKLDFAGNTTADLGENTNLYFTNTRARAAVSVTDAGGLGSLAYNSSTGVITYTGPSNSDIRGLLSIASGSGLTYNSSTGEFGTSAIPNSQLANDDVTIGGTAIAPGGTATDISGLNSVTSSEFSVFAEGQTNSITLKSGQILFEGSTANLFETSLQVTDPTADRTITLPDNSGIVLTTGSSISNSNLANDSFLIGSTTVELGGGATQFHGFSSIQSTKIVSGSGSLDSANSITLESGNITFEGSTADANEIILTAADASGSDKTITLPNATGTVALLSTLSIASGSGLTYNSGTGEFSTNAIPNSQLANSSVTVGSTAIALGNSSTTLAGLSSVTSTAVITNDSGFRIRDNSDNTKQLAFECSGISGSTTRTLTVPDANDTLVVLAASQTLTNKTLTSPVLNTGLSGTAFLDEDDMASNSATKVASQQSIKAYVDAEIAALPQGDITAVTAGAGLSGGGNSGAVTLSIPNSGVSAGSYGSATAIPSITVDARGFVTAVSTNSVTTTTNLGVSTSTTAVTVTSSTGDNATISEASGSAAGVMSVAHHDKLDGIAAGATNVTNTNQLTNGAGFITATLTNEQVQDIVGGMVSGNTETGISVTYQDGDGTLDFVVASQTDQNFTTTLKNKLDGIAAGATNVTNNNQLTNGAGYITSTLTNEQVQDIVGGMLSGNTETGITVTYQDGDGTIDFVVASQTDNNFTDSDHSKLDGIASGATNVTNNNQISNGAGYVTSSIINSLNASNLSSGTIPDARFPATLPAVSGANLTGISAGATGGGSDQIFYENGQNVTTNYTITNGKNAMSAGPITINSGVTVTVGAGETYTVV